MAINALVHSGKEARLWVGEEATFGTAVTDVTAWAAGNTDGATMLQNDGDLSPVDFSEVFRDESIRAHGQRVKKHTDVFVATDGSGAPIGKFMLPFNAIPSRHDVDVLIYACLQDVESEATATPFAKVFTWNRDTTQPSFNGDAGFFCTVTQESPIASENDVLTSSIINSITLSSESGSRLKASGTFLSGHSWTQSNGAPLVTVIPDTDYFMHNLMTTKTLNAKDLVVAGWDITFDNLANRVGSTATGNSQSFVIGVPEYLASGNLLVKYDANSKDVIDDFVSGTDRALVIAWGSAATDGELKFELNVNHPAPAADFANDLGMMINLPFVCVDDGTNDAVKISISNAQDRGWT